MYEDSLLFRSCDRSNAGFWGRIGSRMAGVVPFAHWLVRNRTLG
jgi:hypothetical protein